MSITGNILNYLVDKSENHKKRFASRTTARSIFDKAEGKISYYPVVMSNAIELDVAKKLKDEIESRIMRISRFALDNRGEIIDLSEEDFTSWIKSNLGSTKLTSNHERDILGESFIHSDALQNNLSDMYSRNEMFIESNKELDLFIKEVAKTIMNFSTDSEVSINVEVKDADYFSEARKNNSGGGNRSNSQNKGSNDNDSLSSNGKMSKEEKRAHKFARDTLGMVASEIGNGIGKGIVHVMTDRKNKKEAELDALKPTVDDDLRVGNFKDKNTKKFLMRKDNAKNKVSTFHSNDDNLNKNKLNSEPSYLTVKLVVDSNGEITTLEFTLGIKTIAHIVDSGEYITAIAKAVSGSSGSLVKMIRWVTGELSFFKDLVLDINERSYFANNNNSVAFSIIDRLIKAKVGRNVTKNAYRSAPMLDLKDVQHIQKIADGVSGNGLLPTTTLIFTTTEVEEIRRLTGLSLKNPKVAEQLFDKLDVTSIGIVDPASDTMMTIDNIENPEFETNSMISKKATENKNQVVLQMKA